MRNPKYLKRTGTFAALVGLALLILTACSTGAGPVVAGGNLQITVSGLPQGMDANVLVSGPDGYHQRATKSTTLTKLAPGSYTVTPLGVSKGAMGYQTGKAQTVTISATSGATVKVTYSKLPLKLQPNAVRLDAATSQSLSTVTHDASGNSTLTFSQSTPQLQKLKVGDVIMLMSTKATPGGFMGKVTGISGLTVTTAPAKLTDAVKQGVLALHKTFSASDVQSVQALQPGVEIEQAPAGSLSPQGSLSLPCVKPNYTFSGSTGDVGVGVALTTEGQICPTLGVDMDVTIDCCHHVIVPYISSAHAILSGGVDTKLTVTGQASAGVDFKEPLATYTFEPIDLGDVSEVTPSVDFYVEASGKVVAGISAGVKDNLSFVAGGAYDDDGGWSGVAGFGNSWHYIWPKPSTGVQLKASAGPELNLALDGVGKWSAGDATIGLDGYLEYDVNFLNDPLWKLHGGLEATAGFSALLGLASWSTTLYQKDWVLATSNSTPPKGISFWSYPTGDVLASPALSANGKTLYIGSYVGDGDGTLYALDTSKNSTSRLKWKISVGGVLAAPSVADDGTIYLSTDDGIFAVEPNGGVKWQVLKGQESTATASIGSDGTVYAVTRDDGTVHALNPSDGSEKWHYAVGSAISASAPAIGADGALYVGSRGGVSYEGVLFALNSSSGSLEWKKTLGIDVNTSPALNGGTVYALATEDGAYQVLYALDASSGSILWQVTVNQADEDTSPTIGADGTIYVGSVNHKLYAVDPDTHEVKWSYKTGGLIKGAPTVGADGDIYVTASDTGTILYAIKPNGSLDWKAPLASAGGEAYGVILGGSGAAYVSTGTGSNTGQTQAVHTDSKGLADSPWPKLHHDNQNTGRAR
jgi:outer membrane protein assembly factor BamB